MEHAADPNGSQALLHLSALNMHSSNPSSTPPSQQPSPAPPSSRPPKKPKKIGNPLRAALHTYLTTSLPPTFFTPPPTLSLQTLLSSLPKRFTIYPPLLLLPSNIFNSTPAWEIFYSRLSAAQLAELYACIAAGFGAEGVTHGAMNAPIMLKLRDGEEGEGDGEENRVRWPARLVPLFGDWGPLPGTATVGAGGVLEEEVEGGRRNQLLRAPTQADFTAAFWVKAVQNQGITQIWAPLYSMFSRGNVTEKARIMGLQGRFYGLDEQQHEHEQEDEDGDGLGMRVADTAVVDMYAGIGYFVFSYLKRGVGRVWAWELNAWSVEGLRRGCEANGWGCKVVRVMDDGSLDFEGGGMEELVEGLSEHDRVVVFQGDNKFSTGVMQDLQHRLRVKGCWKPVRHGNLGLLPTSKLSWSAAVEVLDAQDGGWVHVHENVDVAEIDKMKEDILIEFESLVRSSPSREGASLIARPECVHVERVKTYAPGVMHCVFDIRVPPVRGEFSGHDTMKSDET
ncbi:hypothetical protein AJ80_01356 [Polytolypa hystricis UAMH7299]|uniref:tRNA(Phe) (4-demethylwyosine(37)-C(7)) aminocarboxypropyltransferase n=1 Tax=Polytolypa hystricis (strain UAMH7299) TaxID=1447883 RepID=A0A2B7Z1L7_POLH7|nr:hypothetical protein AJ80_01356 [Polytolypa hystricis UAMH7299]